MTITRRTIATYLVGILVVSIVIASIVETWQSPAPSGGGRARSGGEGPVPVLVAIAKKIDVPVYLDGVGTARALNTVTIKPQIDGKLSAILFKEGQDVERGFVLATIDPVTYQAQYDQAVAKKAQDEAQLANAKIDLDRYERLVASNAANRQQMDTQRALVAQLEAQVKQDQAAIDNTKAFLDYTRITAPISGRTGIRLVDAGNIVRASDATGIVVITQLRPISIFFTLPQQQLVLVGKAFAQGQLMVEALGADNRTIVDRGMLQVIDNQVDQTTGTIRLKAEFPNTDLQLWPGQFVNVRLLVDTLSQAIVVPTAAIQRGPSGTFVYIARENNTVNVRPVNISQQDEQQAAIAAGLQADERVVTSGFARLSEGSAIVASTMSGSPPPARGNEQQRRLRGNEGSGPSRDGQRRNERTTAPAATERPR